LDGRAEVLKAADQAMDLFGFCPVIEVIGTQVQTSLISTILETDFYLLARAKSSPRRPRSSHSREGRGDCEFAVPRGVGARIRGWSVGSALARRRTEDLGVLVREIA
jgi:hypothetical protein